MAACVTDALERGRLPAPLAHTLAAVLTGALLAMAPASAAGAAAGAAAAPGSTGIRIEFAQLTQQPTRVLLQQAVITEEDARGNPLKTIRAERAESNSLDVSNSTWTFTGQVVVTIPDGELRADEARVLILKGRISTAAVRGAPAQFEQRGAGTAARASGRAEDIRYDAGSGDLLFTGNVWFRSESTGEVSSSRATYNIPQRISSFEGGGNQRVKGVIITRPLGGAPDKGP